MRTTVGHFIMGKNMNTNNYKGKGPTTFEEQVKILESRNMIIADRKEAAEILSRVNYYRLSAYMLTFKSGNVFENGTTFTGVYELYEFDKRLRSICLNVLESIEIAFRTQISYTLSHKYGPMCYCNPEIFSNEQLHARLLEELKSAIDKSHEQFIDHHKNNYDSQFPIWVVTEVVSFSQLSRLYSLLENKDKKEIADTYYKIPYTYLQSWIRSVSVLRNICAHYGRLYNKTISIKPKLFKQDKDKGVMDHTVFGLIYTMGIINKDQAQWARFIEDLRSLIEEYDLVELSKIGFPDNWNKLLCQL